MNPQFASWRDGALVVAPNVGCRWTPRHRLVVDTEIGRYEETNPAPDADMQRLARALRATPTKVDWPTTLAWAAMLGVVVWAVAKGYVFGGGPA